MTDLATVQRPGDHLARPTGHPNRDQGETEMSQRSYDEIQADITAAADAMTQSALYNPAADFWQATVEGYERLRDLWDEIVRQANEDAGLPDWTRIAAMTTRDHYAFRAHAAWSKVAQP